jgi:outer membrane lipoprotein-sorting protein
MSAFTHVARQVTFCIFFGVALSTSAEPILDINTMLEKMEAAYSGVTDYQARMDVRTYRHDGSFQTDKFLYTFKKPGSIRLDFESPHPGMVLVYPDKQGKAVIRPPGLARFLELHVAPDNPLLRISSGQPIDRTDMGLLIANISRSLNDQRRGPIKMWEHDHFVNITVLAVSHFRPDMLTQYGFIIDKRLWLPVGVDESTPDGHPERRVMFNDLRINIGTPDAFFQLKETEETEKRQ